MLAYSRLGISTPVLLVLVPLALVGIGGGFFRPANQVTVYADVDRKDYGALSAMITSLGTLAGALGTSLTIAVTESRASSDDPVAFAEAIRFTFTALLPLLLVSVFVSLIGRSVTKRRTEDDAASAPADTQAGRR